MTDIVFVGMHDSSNSPNELTIYHNHIYSRQPKLKTRHIPTRQGIFQHNIYIFATIGIKLQQDRVKETA